MSEQRRLLILMLPALAAILAIFGLDGIALSHGIDREVLIAAVAAIGSIGGWTARKVYNRLKL